MQHADFAVAGSLRELAASAGSFDNFVLHPALVSYQYGDGPVLVEPERRLTWVNKAHESRGSFEDCLHDRVRLCKTSS